MSLRTLALSGCLSGCIAVLASVAPPPAHAGEPLKVEARLANAVLKADTAQKTYLRVGLAGCKTEPNKNRPPVNVAFVIDRSGSMQGFPLAQAKEATIMAISRLNGGDIAAVVVFDDHVNLLVPAQPVTDPATVAAPVATIAAGNTTAIYAGVLGGSVEALKNHNSGRLNRVILLSDGQANVGPRNPDEFGHLGRSLLAQGISVSTIGLGMHYNEDLMLKLARGGDGNHAFARSPADLINIFNKEFDDVLGACAQTVSIDVELKPGVRPVKGLSRDAVVDGQHARFTMNQVYERTEHYVLLEVEVDKSIAKGEQQLGLIKVGYTPAGGGAQQKVETPLSARFSSDEADLKSGADPKVTEAVVEQITRERADKAVALRDSGKLQEANQLLMLNAQEIKAMSAALPSPPSARMQELQTQYEQMGASTAAAGSAAYIKERKVLRELNAAPAASGTRY